MDGFRLTDGSVMRDEFNELDKVGNDGFKLVGIGGSKLVHTDSLFLYVM